MQITKLNVSFGERVLYKDFSMEFKDHQVTVILGPSGCGKTTLLNSIARAKGDTDVSYIFQEPRLLPWCTLEKNITLILKGSKEDRTERAHRYLRKVGLEQRIHDYPGILSGGERQRAAIARAFSYPSAVLLMDEPFQSQDPALKLQLISLVKELQDEEKRTILAVTHDIREATALADRAVILNGKPVAVILDIPLTSNFEHQISEVLSCQTSVW